MNKILLKLFYSTNLFPILLPNSNLFQISKNSNYNDTFNVDDYDFNSNSAIRTYTGQLNKEVSDANGRLVETNNFVWQFKLEIDDYDKKIIQNNLLNSYLEFDFTEQATSCGRKVQISNHIKLDLTDINNLTDFNCDYYVIYFCGPDGSKQDAPMNSILHFSFDSNGDLLITTLRRDISTLVEKYEKIEWRKVSISNISLTFNKPEEFKIDDNYEIELSYVTDEIDKEKFQESLEETFAKNPLSKYVLLSSITDDDVANLKQISDNLCSNLEMKINLKNKYDNPLIEKMLAKSSIVVNLNQIINLEKLNIQHNIQIEQGQDPIKSFLEQNVLYKSFLTSKCTLTYDSDLKTISIEGDSDSVMGILKIDVSIKQPKPAKEDLSELDLQNNLGDIYTETDDWFFSDQYYFELWKTKNPDLLFGQQFEDYDFGILQNNEIKITATDMNDKFYGSVTLKFNIITPSDLKKDISKLGLEQNLGNINYSENDNLSNLVFEKFNELNLTMNDLIFEDCEIEIENNIADLKINSSNLKYKGEIKLYFELTKEKKDISTLNLNTNLGQIDYGINDNLNLLIFNKFININCIDDIVVDDLNITSNDSKAILTIINDDSGYEGELTVFFNENIQVININDLKLDNEIDISEINNYELNNFFDIWFDKNKSKEIPKKECLDFVLQNTDSMLISVNNKTKFYTGNVVVKIPNNDNEDIPNNDNGNGESHNTFKKGTKTKNIFIIVGSSLILIFSIFGVIFIVIKKKIKRNKK